ncbi:MAG TPA: hypothetical protein VL137_15165 [Polyangiaceae bacterium]|jgi:hypothetical protein|nr:hypothetical protein [Polyangiaceae bacterium]
MEAESASISLATLVVLTDASLVLPSTLWLVSSVPLPWNALGLALMLAPLPFFVADARRRDHHEF